MRSWYSLAALGLGLSSCSIDHSGMVPAVHALPLVEQTLDPELQKHLQSSLDEVVTEKQIPGMAVAVVRGNVIVARAVAGLKKVGGSQPIEAGDRFHIASLAKPMTATVIGGLVEEGRLQWSTPVLEVFPKWRTQVHPSLREITLEQILQHRAGFHPFRAGSDWTEQGVPSLTGSLPGQRQQFARWLMSKSPPRSVGKFEYSNAGYVVAAAMAEKITGQSWEQLIKSRLFLPLGIKSAGFGWPRTAGPNQPQGHYLRDSKRYEAQAPDDPYKLRPVMAPSGDIHMTVEDLARFAAAHLAGLGGRDGVVKAATINRLHTPPVNGSYASGWDIDVEQFEEPWSQHTGATGTFRTRVWVFPASNLAMVASANADSDDVHMGASLVFQRMKAAAVKKH